METDEVIDDILQAILEARRGVPVLEEWSPVAAGIAAGGLTVLSEGLSLVRTWRQADPDKVRRDLAKRCEAFIQELAAVRFGKKEGT